MELEPGWLQRQVKKAHDEFTSWPEPMRERYQREIDAWFAESKITDEEYQMRRIDSQKYGNY